MSDDEIRNSEEWKAHEKAVREDLIPKLESSAVCVAIAVGELDVYFATQLGMMIMLDKPIVALVRRGDPVPKKLAAVADLLLDVGPDGLADPVDRSRLQEALAKFVAERGLGGA